jgi:hypothetical protein
MVMSDLDDRSCIAVYRAKAIYFTEADLLEYTRLDVPTVHRRVDECLTLVLSMDDRQPIGFALKGFRHLCQKHIYKEDPRRHEGFKDLVSIFEKIIGEIGDDLFYGERYLAYNKAIEIATADKVELHDYPLSARL